MYANQAYDVHMFPEIAQNTGSENSAQRGDGDAYREVLSAVNNRRVTTVPAMGFSYGGGATFNLVDRLVASYDAGLINYFALPYQGQRA